MESKSLFNSHLNIIYGRDRLSTGRKSIYIYIYIGLQNLKIQINMKLTNLLQQLLLGEKIQLKY